MAESLSQQGVHQRLTTWSVNNDESNSRRASLEAVGSSNFPSNGMTGSSSLGVSKSRRTLRHSSSTLCERKAYPLPDPRQFETTTAFTPAQPSPCSSSSSSLDPTNEILYPLQSFKRFAERERASKSQQTSPRETPPSPSPATSLKQPSRMSLDENQPFSISSGDKQPFSVSLGDKQPCMGLKEPASPIATSILKAASNSIEVVAVLGTPPEEEAPSSTKPRSLLRQQQPASSSSVSRVVVVYDAEKKFSTAAVDVALQDFATTEGDAVVVVAFLEHVLSPMGMKMVADVQQFSGVNEAILKQTVHLKKSAIEGKLRDSSRMQICATKKIQLDVKVLPGSNPKALVAKEILDYQATCAIFDKNAMNHRKYYADTLPCQALRLRSDKQSLETIALVGHDTLLRPHEKRKPSSLRITSAIGSHCSDTSSSSSSDSSSSSSSPSMWSKLKLFGGSKRTPMAGAAPRGAPGGGSTTSSNLGSPRPLAGREEELVLDESFSFDSPKVNGVALEKFGVYHGLSLGARGGEGSLPRASAAQVASLA